MKKQILSLGAGVQSSCLALMAARGETPERLNAAVFADTQNEPPNVYTWLDWLESEISRSKYPFPIIRVSRGDLAEASLRVRTSKKTGMTYLKHSIPAYMLRANGAGGIMGRACTLDYKIIQIQKAAKDIVRRFTADKTASGIIWIGISTDEAHRMKPSRVDWLENIWPLIDLGMSRQDCLDWTQKNGYQKPPRSSCEFCPYHSDAEWRRLKNEAPESFQRAVNYEKRLQMSVSQVPRLDGVPFLHHSRMPLDQVEFDKSSQQLSLFGNECEGICGV